MSIGKQKRQKPNFFQSFAGIQKRRQMKFSLLRQIAQLSCNRTCITCQATPGMALRLRGLQQEAGTAIYIVATTIKSVDRATMQAGLGGTGKAGRPGLKRFFSASEFSTQQRKPIRMPEPELGVHHHTDRGLLERFGTLRPLLKRVVRWSCERIDRLHR